VFCGGPCLVWPVRDSCGTEHLNGRIARLIVAVVSFFAWAILFALALEACERLATRNGVVDGYTLPIIARAEKQDAAVIEATSAAAPQPPADIVAKYPSFDALDGATEDQLKNLAEQWEGVIFQCDLRGAVQQVHTSSKSRSAMEFAAMAAYRANVSEILAGMYPQYRDDIRRRLDMAAAAWSHPSVPSSRDTGRIGPCVDYMVPLPDSPNAGFRFLFHVFQAKGVEQPTAYVVVVPWRWQFFFRWFRPNHYERDTYPQFPKSEFWTNSRGFRDGEIAVPKPSGVYRIVCIGGSTTLEGPRNDLTYPKTLQKLLCSHLGTNKIEVINCGVDGGSIRGQGALYDDCLALEPDLVIHYNFINDVRDLMDDVWNSTVLTSGWRRAVMEALSRSHFLTRRCRGLWTAAVPGEADYRNGIERLIMPSLRELCERTKKAGAQFAVASFAYPDLHHISPIEQAWFRFRFNQGQVKTAQFDDYVLAADVFNGVVRSYCAREGLPYVPVAEEMNGGLETFTDTCHMHVSGICRKARIMFDHLKDIVSKKMETAREPSAPPQQ